MRLFSLLGFWAIAVFFSLAHAQPLIQAKAQFPAFFYQGDQPKIQFELFNAGDREQTGNLQLELFDALKKQPVDGWFYNQLANQYFTLAPEERSFVRFPVTIPHLFSGKIDWQLTLRSDSTRQVINGSFLVLPSNEEEPIIDVDQVAGAKFGRHLLSHNTIKEKAQEKTITPFATQPLGQSIIVRFKLSLGKTHDSCRLEIPFSAGLQPTGPVSLHKKGNSTLRQRQTLSDTAIITTFYGLTPGTYQFDYYFQAHYPGQFLLPASRMFFGKFLPRQMTTTSDRIEID